MIDDANSFDYLCLTDLSVFFFPGRIALSMESETLAAMAGSLKVSDTGGHPDGQSARNQEEDCFYDCEETFHAERTSLAVNQTEVTHGEGTANELQTESVRNPDVGEESAQASDPSEGNAATRGHEPGEDDTVLGEGAYERIGEEDERRTDADSEFKEEATKPSEYDDEYLREAEKNLSEEEKEVSSPVVYTACDHTGIHKPCIIGVGFKTERHDILNRLNAKAEF